MSSVKSQVEYLIEKSIVKYDYEKTIDDLNSGKFREKNYMVKDKIIQIIHTNLQEYMKINDVAMHHSNGLIKYVFDIDNYNFEILYNYVDSFYRIVVEKRLNNQLQNVVFLTKSKKFHKDIKISLKKFNSSRKSFEDHMNSFTLYIVGILEKHETLNYLDETYIPDLIFDGIFI